MQVTSKPPLLPPPVPVHAQNSDTVRKRLWYTIAVILLLVILMLLLIAWLFSSGIGAGGLGSGGGGGGRTSGKLGLGDQSESSSLQPSASSGQVAGTTSGNNLEPLPKSTAPVESGKSQGSAPDNSQSDSSGGSETALLIYDSSDKDEPKVEAIENTDKPSLNGLEGSGKGNAAIAAGGSNPFIGSGPPAKSVVYVIDCSSSMGNADRLPRTKASLLRAIDQLKPAQKFKLICFNDHYITDGINDDLLPATKSNKQKVLQWLERVGIGGGTNPWPAMAVAIKLKPERIVLMSDGEFDPTIVGQITQLNQANKNRKAQIDGAGLDESIETLKQVAQQNQGTYYQMN